MAGKWKISLTKTAKKQAEKLSISGQKPSIIDSIGLLITSLEEDGPEQISWPNYGKLKGQNAYHCHLKKGKPTFVACWRIESKDQKK